ncbi:MAG TPA: hypothetical protein VFQ61_08825, partial [Polyangiaceae bacterium]|nr:hypothetical protein [Polyangiaceae bacterium]
MSLRTQCSRRLGTLIPRWSTPTAAALLGLHLLCGCSLAHTATVRTAALPPPSEPVIRHSARLWLDIFPGVNGTQCVMPPQATREVCFDAVEDAVQASLSRVLWTSFPRVDVLGRGDTPAPEDYVLHLD